MEAKNALSYFKFFYSMALLIFCVTLVMACIFTGQSTAKNYNMHPIVAFCLFWFLILWLAMMEGGQGCLVGLKPIEKNLYEKTHPTTHKCTTLAHKGDNIERFIVGRQFLVVLVIFLINLCGSPIKGADPLGLPAGVNSVFLANGIGLMLTTIDIGQLPSQVNAAVYMLDFINNYFMLFTTYVSLAIEFSGLLHSVYLVQYAFAAITRKPVESNEPPRSTAAKIFFWTRVLVSVAILTFALAVTLKALLEEKSGMWEGVPVSASIVIFFAFLCLVGLMEGMQIAAFALLNMPEEKLMNHKIAERNCNLMFDGHNLQSFLIGRQIFVAAIMFIVARIATISIDKEAGETNIFNVSDGFQTFLDTGLLGAVILTIIGSLAWRIVASSFPIAFMSNPVIYVIIRICFFLEATGICASAWLLALVHQLAFKFKIDDDYLNKDSEDKLEKPSMGEKAVSFRVSLAPTARRSNSIVCDPSELLYESDEGMSSKVDKMKRSLVTSLRRSSVMSIRDMNALVEETEVDERTGLSIREMNILAEAYDEEDPEEQQ